MNYTFPEREELKDIDVHNYDILEFEITPTMPVRVKYDPSEHRVVVQSDAITPRDDPEILQDRLNLDYEAREYGHSTQYSVEVYLAEESGMALTDEEGEEVFQILEPRKPFLSDLK